MERFTATDLVTYPTHHHHASCSSPLPAVQVTELQGVAGNRHKCLLTDGSASIKGVFATQLSELFATGSIGAGAVVRVNQYVMNTIGNDEVLMVTEAEVVTPAPSAASPMDTDIALSSHNAAPSAANTPTTAVKAEGAFAAVRPSAAIKVEAEKENSTPQQGASLQDE